MRSTKKQKRAARALTAEQARELEQAANRLLDMHPEYRRDVDRLLESLERFYASDEPRVIEELVAQAKREGKCPLSLVSEFYGPPGARLKQLN
jgi:hypothetical protein